MPFLLSAARGYRFWASFAGLQTALLLLGLPACEGNTSSPTCGVEGSTQECVCAPGTLSVQSCQGDGAWTECLCNADADESRDTSQPSDADTADEGDATEADIFPDTIMSDTTSPDSEVFDEVLGPDSHDTVPDAPVPADATSDQDSEEPLDTSEDFACPIARIAVQEGAQVPPLSALTLTGLGSTADRSSIQSYLWQVDQPPGSRSSFEPSSTVATPTFVPTIAGQYTFRLFVTDARGLESCTPASYTVSVLPEAALHVELLWHTPNSPDNMDTGPDLDLHLAHQLAVGGYDGDADGQMDGWYDIPYDCFSDNPAPNWGAFDPAVNDNPSLEREEADGTGPEIISLPLPENGVTYRVGVHYRDAKTFGNSFARVRIYIYGDLVLDSGGVELRHRDMWTVTQVPLPHVSGANPSLTLVCEGTTTSCTTSSQCGAGILCAPRIAPNYNHPDYFLP